MNLAPTRLASDLKLPGDKSLSHRVLMMSALARGRSSFRGLSPSQDVNATLRILKSLGTEITLGSSGVEILGQEWHAPKVLLDCGNSGTTARHFLGLLAGQKFASELQGDESLSKRPMGRVVEPLRSAGAEILLSNGSLPAKVEPAQLNDISHELKIPSAQIKSSLLLAGVAAGRAVCLTGELGSRDHTERLIPCFGGELSRHANRIQLPPQPVWHGWEWNIPSDPSSAAFWVAAALLSGTALELSGVLLNPYRTGFFEVVRRMGAQIDLQVECESPEPIGTISVRPSKLTGWSVPQEWVPSLIDEIPLLVLLGSQAEGEMSITGAGELKVKESDRILATARVLGSLGVRVKTHHDGFFIRGGQKLSSGTVDPEGDHRLAMLAAVASFVAPVELLQPEVAAVSDPLFWENFARC